ncbi:prepilin peptidase [Pengzhenrongella frigida]|uniref:Prepilin leader peptidase/N-methyltransferase n=1 Tax=Pengzhenrongella frigida TaxID=1259133 RepID=A0A4Q5N3Y1_9MICO|nr:prepilin peptidase [Cellulomonas sp. HLT2-17]
MDGAIVVAFAALFGLAIGSFLNVVVWRVPRGESIVSPPSACPKCHHVIRSRDNIPVISWLLLGGRCRDCREPIAARYPLVEASTGVLFGLVALRFGVSWALPAFCHLAAVAVALALIDIDVHRLPNAIVLPAYPVALVLLGLASWNPGGTADWPSLVRALIGGAALYAFYFVLMMVYPAGMGFGDVKLAGVLGLYLAWVGWGALVIGAFAAFLVGGVFSIALLAAGKATRKSGIPFGPWMLAGAAIGIAAGEQLWSAYLSILV